MTAAPRSAEWTDRPDIGHLFLLAVIRHAGPIRVDLHVAPRILLVTARPDIALVNGLRACVAEFAAVLLCIAWRRERGRGEYYGKHSQTLLQVNHEAFPSIVAWSAERTPIAQHIYPLRGDLAQSILMQSMGYCGKVECSRDPRCTSASATTPKLRRTGCGKRTPNTASRFSLVYPSSSGYAREFVGMRRWDLAVDREQEPQKWRAHIATVEAHEPFRSFRYRGMRPDGLSV